MLKRCNTPKHIWWYVALNLPHIVWFDAISPSSHSPTAEMCVRIDREQDRHSSLDFALHFKEFFGCLPAMLRSKYSLAIRIYQYSVRVVDIWMCITDHSKNNFDLPKMNFEQQFWRLINSIRNRMCNSCDGRSEWCVDVETQTIASKYAWMTL